MAESFQATHGKIWATFYFNIWSHCLETIRRTPSDVQSLPKAKSMQRKKLKTKFLAIKYWPNFLLLRDNGGRTTVERSRPFGPPFIRRLEVDGGRPCSNFLFTFRKKQKPPFDFCRSNVPRMLQAAAVVDLFVMAGVCEASTTYLHVPTYLGSPISIFSSCNAAIHFFPSSLSLLLNFSLSLYLYCYRRERPLLRFSLCRSFILAYTFTK